MTKDAQLKTPQLSPHLKQTAQTLVQKLMDSLPGVRDCVISTEDGFNVAAHKQSKSTTRLSAMASSMAALGVVAGGENRLGACSSVVVEADAGLIVIVHARRADVTLVLSLVAGADAVLGQVLYAARDAARQLEQV